MQRRIALRAVGLLVLSALLPLARAAAAPPEGKGKPEKADKGAHGSGQGPSPKGGAASVSVSVSWEEARGLAVAQGYTGYAALPPGIRKNLARGKPLPPGIAKKAVPAPLLAQLPAYPGYEWLISGADLVLVAIGTAIVAEVLSGVFQ